jgi:HemY protein
LNETLAAGDYREALALVRRAEELQPKRAWVVRTLFDLETRNREWLKAERTQRKAEKLGLFDPDAATAHRQAIWTAMSQDAEARGEEKAALRLAESAWKLDAGFTPAALRLAGLLEARGKRRAALKIVERAWEKNPHPALGALWMSWAPAAKKTKSLYDAGRGAYDWAKRLDDLAPGHRDGQRLLGQAALDARLWREARAHLVQGADYRLLARLEQEESGNEAKAREWLEKAAESPADPRWTCRACGHAAASWQALCPHCGHFNSLSWLTPGFETHEPQKAIAPGHDLLGPPRYAEI